MEVTFCATKAGKGFKIVVDGVWLYTSKFELYRVLQNKALACQFREIDKEVAQKQQVEIPAEDKRLNKYEQEGMLIHRGDERKWK